MNISKEQFTKLAKEHLIALESYKMDKNGNKPIEIFGIEKLYEAINYTHCYTELPTSTQLLSDCKKRFKELEGKGNLDFRSYMNGYLDSFSKNVVSKM
jgi:hypothetical protein